MQIILIYFAIKYQGNWDAIYKALETKERVTLQQITETEALIAQQDCAVITILDLTYPAPLKMAYKPPFVIWLKGDLSVSAQPLWCLTGSNTSPLINKWINAALSQIATNVNLVVRDFSAVDLQINAQSIARKLYLLPGGFEAMASGIKVQPTDLVISEYPPGTSASKDTYRARNRLIAAFASHLVLFSSLKDNGINHLVNCFLNLGKEVYCYPGDGSDEDGNSELIKQGALLITNISEIDGSELNVIKSA